MKQFVFLLTFLVCSCKQPSTNANQNSVPPNTPEAKKEVVAETSKPKGILSQLTMQDGGAVVPNPLKKRYTLENSNPESDLHQVFFKYKEFDNTKTIFEASMPITMDLNTKAYDYLEQIRHIEKGKTFEATGPPCVGKSGTSFNLAYFNGDSATFNVTGGALCEKDKLPAAISGVHDLMESLAAEVQAEQKLRFFKVVNGQKWQNKADASHTLSFNNGRLTVTKKGITEPPLFVHFSSRCPNGKKAGEGMNAGNLGCMTTWAQDEIHYRITDFGQDVFEFNETPSTTNKDGGNTQVFKRVVVSKK
jgi:hypothetical protein